MRLYRGPRDNEPRARQSTGARGGMGDGFRHKHQPQIQRGTRKERSRRGLGWPTQQLALRFIQSIDRLFRSFPVRQGQGKTREGTLLPNTRGDHWHSKRLEVSSKEHAYTSCRSTATTSNANRVGSMGRVRWAPMPKFTKGNCERRPGGGLGWPARRVSPHFRPPSNNRTLRFNPSRKVRQTGHNVPLPRANDRRKAHRTGCKGVLTLAKAHGHIPRRFLTAQSPWRRPIIARA